MADVVGAACLLHQRQVPLHLLPLAGGGVTPVAVGPGIGPVVNVAAAHQALVLAVGHDEFAQGLGPAHGLPHPLRVLNPLPSSEKATT